MTAFFFFLALLQCALLWLMGRAGQIQLARADMEKKRAAAGGISWPACSLIIPVAGNSPLIESALRSLMQQDYPEFHVYMVTASEAEPASAIIERLALEYPNLTHVVAGKASACGQKNHNLLAGCAAAGYAAPLYAFCDSTHLAEPDFLCCLLFPQASGKAAFSSGYHEVVPKDSQLVTLAYAINVLFMRFMQGIPGLTQPWGGAMGMTRQAFEELQIASLWSSNVVDDCSLGAFLRKKGIKVAYCPGAMLRTLAAGHARAVWVAWLERQILFLKFCFPGEWLGLCLFSCFMLFPFLWAGLAVLEGLLNFGSVSGPFLALCWFFLFLGEMGVWKNFLPIKISSWKCFIVFLLSCAMFWAVSLRTIVVNKIRWHNISYRVGKNGQVLSIKSD